MNSTILKGFRGTVCAIACLLMFTVCGDETPPEPGTITPDTVPVTDVILNKQALELAVGEQATLTATVMPVDATNQNTAWTSTEPDVATVDDGLVAAMAEGTAVIIVSTADGGKTKTCTVTVTKADVAVTGIILDQTALTLTEGSSATLKATVKPENADNTAVEWSSSNTSVATVNADGRVVGVAKGSANITVTTDEGEFTATCSVTVEEIPNHPVLGKVKFVTPETWIVGNYEWSDAVTAAYCKKTQYYGGNEQGFEADCRMIEGYDDLFSWEAVNQYGDALCPGGWRVPTKEDICILDKTLNSVSDCVRRNDQTAANRFIQEWNARPSGFATMNGELVGTGVWCQYWTQTPFTGEVGYSYFLTISLEDFNINPTFTRYMAYGLTVRCVRDIE